ncbi:hypothetical protein EIK77_006498 [Talaromyces pinophilus]|jgi:hypothetical protein|nr:hypothetical protein DPV78_004674 [Talaromyces pinophilus]KAI7968479.1 hypothetical protein EIK77_006498 [Talaromyces pinophilus]PCG92762.1 hypothetical protein PENOC_090880 [Penicillium occitanis (nom. inval.)]PCH03625.1 Hypothetical protein PENO1_031510 [Penicillium occitanis (nom. inval.)]
MKTSIIATFVGLVASNALVQVAQAANCEGSHYAAWGGTTWNAINAAIEQTCNSQPYNSGYKSVQDVAGYNVAAAEADVGTGGSPNCWAAMYQIRDQCLDTGNGKYATQGWWQYGDEYYFLWAWDEADCRNSNSLPGYGNAC